MIYHLKIYVFELSLCNQLRFIETEIRYYGSIDVWQKINTIQWRKAKWRRKNKQIHEFSSFMQVNHNSWMCRSFKPIVINCRWFAKKQPSKLSNVRCAKFFIIWFSFGAMHDFIFLCALAMWIISSLMLAIKKLYVHTNHLTDQPSVDCMLFDYYYYATVCMCIYIYFKCKANWIPFVCL